MFLNIHQERFAQQDRIALENFDSATVVLTGVIQSVEDNEIVLEREGVRFPVEMIEETIIFSPVTAGSESEEVLARTGRFPLQQMSFEDLAVGQIVRVVALFSNGGLQAIDITLISP